MNDLKTFRVWCQKVLPLVYDNSLSYYEVLCKVVDYINKLIEHDVIFGDELEALRKEIKQVEDSIKNFDTSTIDKIVREYLATMIFVEISKNGYFIYHIPNSWKNITFKTTELDTHIPDVGYGHLVLYY